MSVCLTPAAPSPLPIPYPVLGSSIEGITDSLLRTKINGAIIATVGSVIKTCHGNEPGTLKEVVSLNTAGPCALIIGAPNVLIELGMAGMTGSICVSNKAPTPGVGGSATNAGGTGDPSGGGGGGEANGTGGPSGGGGSGGGGSNTDASAPGSSSAAAGEHQCQGGHPVDLVTGCVVDEAVDLSLTGAIPLLWKRYYSSSRRSDGEATLGPGWAHGFEQRLTEEENTFTLREGEGRSIYFAKSKPGTSSFHRRERLTLHHDREGNYRIFSLKTRLTSIFERGRSGGPSLLRSVRDAWDNAITLEYDGERLQRLIDTAGREVKVAWSRGRIIRLEVRASERLVQWVDYTYSAAGCLASAIDVLGHADEYEYDRFNRMTATIIKTGVRFQYEYEANSGRCLKTWGQAGLYAIKLRADRVAKTTYVDGEEPRVITWNDLGLVTREALPDGTVLEEAAYDEDGHLIARTNGAGEGQQSWYDARGSKIRQVDALHNVTAWDYDDRDLPKRRVTAEGLVTEYSHDDKGALSSIRFPSGEICSFSYDGRGRITSIVSDDKPFRAFQYDKHHNVVVETDARGNHLTYAHDDLGRPVARTDVLGRTTRVTYDRLGRRLAIRHADGSTQQLAYDARGKVVRETDPLGQVTMMAYSGMGVLSRLVQPGGQAWSFEHTSQERLVEIKNPNGESHSFSYDAAGRMTVEKTFDGRVLRYARGEKGRVARLDYPDESFRVFSYDRAGRTLGEADSDGSVITYRRDRMGRLVGASLDQDGRQSTTLFERDALGRVVTERQQDRTLHYAYDSQGRRVKRILPDGATTNYTYDSAGALAAVEHAGHLLSFRRDAAGREVQRSSGAAVSILSTWDAVDQLVEQRAVAPAPGEGVPRALVTRQWRYDPAGRLTRVDDSRWGMTTYRYDRLDQLIEAHGGSHQEAFAYDGAGSLVKALGALGAGHARKERWKIAPGGLLAESDQARYTYDARGRRIRKLEPRSDEQGGSRATEYTWDCRDLLREVKLAGGDVVRMTYDAFGRRIRKEVVPCDAATTRVTDYVWDGDTLAADMDQERGVRTFVHAPGTMIPLLQQDGKRDVFTYVNDHLNMPRELIDPAGKVAWAANHDAWGSVADVYVDPEGEQGRKRTVSSPFRLYGQIADEETGLCWTRFRCFDPEVGRWCTPDPLGIDGGLNLFAFGGSPTFVTDPLGLAIDGGNGHDHDPTDEQPSLKKLQEKHLENQGVNAHALKEDIVGKGEISKWDIAQDTSSCKLWLVPHRKGTGENQPTGMTVEEAASVYPRATSNKRGKKNRDTEEHD